MPLVKLLLFIIITVIIDHHETIIGIKDWSSNGKQKIYYNIKKYFIHKCRFL